MKPRKWISAVILLLLSVGSTLGQVMLRGEPDGPASLQYRNVELLANNHFHLADPLLLDAKGKAVSLEGKTTITFDVAKMTWQVAAPWGEATCAFTNRGDTLEIRFQIANHSAATLANIEGDLLELRFPQQPRGKAWDQHFQVRGDNVDDVTAVVADYGNSQAIACNDDVAQPLWFGFSSPVAENTYRLQFSTRITNSKFDSVIAPGATREFRFSLRFAPADQPVAGLTQDLSQALAQRFPFQLKWPDRRPIAMIALASHAHQTAINPRGWFNEGTLNIVDKSGTKRFRKRLMDLERLHLEVLKQQGAQGIVVWNIEGEEFGNITYVGDPRMLPKLAPEMDAAADDYFKRIRDAGLRTGVCIRPTRIIRDVSGANPWMHFEDGVDAVTEMSAKIDYAQKRWGCTLFYIDTSVHYFRDRDNAITTRLISTAEWIRLAKLHPDVLLIPEFASTASWSVCAPYRELRPHTFGGFASTPANVLAVYPRAFSILNPNEGPIQERRAELINSVRRGDILLFRGFFHDTANDLLRQISRDAAR